MDKDVTIDAGSAMVVREILATGKTYEVVTVPAVAGDKTNIVANSDLTSVDQLVVVIPSQ